MGTHPIQTPGASVEIRRGVRLWLRKQITFLIILVDELLLSAGTLRWREGWVCLGLSAAVIALTAATLIPSSRN